MSAVYRAFLRLSAPRTAKPLWPSSTCFPGSRDTLTLPRLLNLEQARQSISSLARHGHCVHGNPEGRGHLQSSDPEPAAPAHTATPWASLWPVLGASEDSWLCPHPLGWSSLSLPAAYPTLALSSSPSPPTPILQPSAGLAAHSLPNRQPSVPSVHQYTRFPPPSTARPEQKDVCPSWQKLQKPPRDSRHAFPCSKDGGHVRGDGVSRAWGEQGPTDPAHLSV